jgi:glycine cleavage system transcriptional repressor
MILIAQLPAAPRFEALRAALDAAAGELGVHVDLRDLGSRAPQPPPAGRRLEMTVYGADHPGIVCRVAEALARLDCNVTNVTTHVAGAVYLVMIEMTVPEVVGDEALAVVLAPLRAELAVDITVRAVEEETL